MEAMKRCNKCGEEKPASPDYFSLRKDSGRLRNECHECLRLIQASKRRAKGITARSLSVTSNGKRCCTQCKAWKPATLEYFDRYKEGLKSQCKECQWKYRQGVIEDRARYSAEYYIRNREAMLAASRERYHTKERDRKLIQGRIRYAQNKERYRIAKRLYDQKNPHIAAAQRQRRRARKLALPNTWTGQHWLRCLDYWNHCCAVCEKQLRDLFGEIITCADHWIPLNYKGADNPGTVPSNMICLCGSCNFSKQHHLPAEWLNRKFGARKAKAILQRIQAYFDWIKSQPE